MLIPGAVARCIRRRASLHCSRQSRILVPGERIMRRLYLTGLAIALALSLPLAAQEKKKQEPSARPTPTAAKVAYGDHERQVFDFWQAKSEQPTPLVLFIHGGGWVNGDKNGIGAGEIQGYLDKGISVA